MKYIVECSNYIHQRVIELIAEGRYTSMQDFALTAFQNQLVIEDTEVGIQDVAETSSGQTQEQLAVDYSNMQKKLTNKDWSLDLINTSKIQPVDLSGPIDKEDWIFGQINRVLPIKFAVRMLMLLLQEKGQWIPLDWFHQKASSKAREYGTLLAELDEKENRKRDEKLSVGFPTGSVSKSIDRYITQFLGYVKSTTGDPVGALPLLRFAEINKSDSGEYSIGITLPGLEFGRLQNACIDNIDMMTSMSDDETEFYIEHVSNYVPFEAEALFTLLSLINQGKRDPSQLDNSIKDLFPNWSDSQISTNRSGVIGRAWDVGLIEKIKDGLYVKYALSNKGVNALDTLSEKN